MIIHQYPCTSAIQDVKDREGLQCCTAAYSTAPSNLCPGVRLHPFFLSQAQERARGLGVRDARCPPLWKKCTEAQHSHHTWGHTGDVCCVRGLRITLGQKINKDMGGRGEEGKKKTTKRAGNQTGSSWPTHRDPRFPDVFNPIPAASSPSRDGTTSAAYLVLALWNTLTQKTLL